MSSKLRQLPLHPLLVAVYPILALLAHNISQVKPAAALRPLVIVCCAAILLWGLLFAFIRDVRRSALLASWWLVLFFMYGHVYFFLGERTSLGHHRFLLPLWILLAAAGSWWMIKQVKDLAYITMAFNGTALVLFIFPMVQVGSSSLNPPLVPDQQDPLPPEFASLRLPEQQTPDIYYIILDAYARDDVLQRVFSFDNSSFTDWLREKGFYVASCSQSNYALTELSLSSSLYLSYIEDLPVALPTGNSTTDRLIIRSLLQHNSIRRALHRLGYRLVAFETGFLFSQFENADVYLSAGKWEGLSSFEELLIQTSGGLLLDDVAPVLLSTHRESMNDPEAIRYRQVMFTLDQLRRVPADVLGPKFVFAHIVAPHLPFVFDADGKPVHYAEHPDDAAYLQGYRDELIYLNQSVKEVVERILSDSPTPPIIIIQSDHGHDYASRADRMAILNAFYLPGGGEAKLYSSISPVNSFRVVLNQYFGGEFELLEDRSYFSYYQTPFEFNYVPNECK